LDGTFEVLDYRYFCLQLETIARQQAAERQAVPSESANEAETDDDFAPATA